MRMKLFYSPFHSFIHKALVTTHEAGLWDDIDFVPTFPFRNVAREFVTGQYPMDAITPLGKVPCLAIPDGTVLYGSQVVVEYLDSVSKANRLYPSEGPARWDALRRLALGDSLFEFSIEFSMESWLPKEERRTPLYEWLWPKMIRALDALESEAPGFSGFDIGHAGMLQGISYFAARCEGNSDDPVHPNYNWRAERPALVAWYDQAIERPSVRAHFNKDYEGDMSPEYHQAQIREILDAQARAKSSS